MATRFYANCERMFEDAHKKRTGRNICIVTVVITFGK